MLANFLNMEKDLPIVAHNAEYDRDDVLRPTFEKVSNIDGFPTVDRWVCTIELAKKRTDLVPPTTPKGLDSLLSHFGLEPRDTDTNHDAHIDCVKTAQLYMKLSKESEKCF